MSPKCRILALLAMICTMVGSSDCLAQKKYDPGANDTEIKIGNIMPYSGPASSYGVIGQTEAAYFRKINDEGGINGRKIAFISYDDSYSPPKAVEQARKLVESDEVLLIFQPLGAQSNVAIQKDLNAKKVPQLFVASGGIRSTSPGQRVGNPTIKARAASTQNTFWSTIPMTRSPSCGRMTMRARTK
jgi:ABC-type branched-subunit amino acid transport system substrate-binding protein